MFQNDSETTGTKSRRLERQRAQVIDRDEKRFHRLQGVQLKAAVADVTFAEQVAAADGQDAQLFVGFNADNATEFAEGTTGSAHAYTVSSPHFDSPRLARRPEPVTPSSGLRPGGFISVTTGRARRRRRG